MRLRQVVLVVADLEAVVGQLCGVFGIEVAYRDPDVEFFDLHNAVIAVGDTFIEVVSPLNDEAAAARYRARRGGDCGYMVMVQSDDYARDRARVDALGVRIVWSAELDDISGMHLHPRDTGGPLLSLDEPRPPAAWRWAGPDWHKLTEVGNARAVTGVEIADPDPATRAGRWSEILAWPVQRDGDVWQIQLERGALRFVDATSPTAVGLTQIDLALRDPDVALDRAAQRHIEHTADTIVIGGTRFHLSAC